MNYQHILSAFYSTPLAILPEKLLEIRAFLAAKARGENIPPERIAQLAAARRHDGAQTVGRVAILPVFGVLAQRVGSLEAASGGVSTEEIGHSLDALVGDREIKAVVLAFDSPGGSVYGVEELATKIRGYRDQKKIVGIADSVAASAAYWLLAQTSDVYVTPGGQVGSIGVLAAHTDLSEWEKAQGFRTTYVTSSPHKAEHAPESPLSDEARAELQAKVNHYHGVFVASIAKGRGITEHKVEKSFGQGRMVTAEDAVARGMVDKVGTLETVLRRLGADSPAAKAALPATLAAIRARAVEVD